jgi:hypothetical protein
MVHLDMQISLRIFEKIRNDPSVIYMGLGKIIHEKKSEAKNLVNGEARRFFNKFCSPPSSESPLKY